MPRPDGLNLALSGEQELLRDSFAKFFRVESSPARVRAAEPLGFDAALWSSLVGLGAPVMRAPEAAGGGAASLLDATILAEEAGRHLASVPLAESIVAARLLAEAGGAVGLEWFQRIANGSALVTLALRPASSGVQTVPGGAVSNAVLALDGDALVLVVQTPTMAAPANLGSGPLARLDLSKGERHVLAANGGQAFLAGLEEWKLLTAAMLAGLGRQALEMAAAYSRERIQFGKPIGSFQGIAHPLADSATEMDGAHLLVRRAVWAIARGRPDAAASVSMASWWAGDAVGRAVTRSVRTFGGYGVSLDYDIQLYFRRGKAWSLMNGDPRNELLNVADRLWRDATVPLPDAGTVEIEFGYGQAAEDFAANARRFFEQNLTPQLRAKAHHSTDGHDPEFHRQLAAAGFAYPDWPKEYGDARSAYENSALGLVFEEFGWTRVPIGITNMVARSVMRFGSAEAKAEALPKFADGQALCALGFSEPESGSDVFAARTRAVRNGDDWVIDGQKMFTTGAHMADYVLLLARTNPDAPKHAGLTLFLVPLSLPGCAIHAVHTLQDERTNITYYDSIRVPDRYRLGDVDHGIDVMAAAMEIEHGGESYHLPQLGLMKAAVAWARNATDADGRPMIAGEEVRARLAVAAVHTEAADVLCRRVVWAATVGLHSRYFGPMSKMFSTDTYMRDSADLLALTGPDSLIQGNHPLGQIELKHRQSIGSTIYGGTLEIHRSIIAENALGMPKSRN